METGILIGSQGGIGKAIYHDLSTRYHVITGDRIKLKDDPQSYILDVTNTSSIKKFFHTIPKKNYTFLVITTGMNDIVTLPTFSKKNAQHVFDVNYFGVIECIQQTLPFLSKTKKASIVVFSSQATLFGGKNMWTYAASKAALNVSVTALAKELGPLNIRINAISPGIIDTSMQDHLSLDERMHKEKSIPLQRFGTPQDVAKCVAWLITDESSYISGSIIPMHGGGRV